MSREVIRDISVTVLTGYIVWVGANTLVNHENDTKKVAILDRNEACADSLTRTSDIIPVLPDACRPFSSEFFDNKTTLYKVPTRQEFNTKHANDADAYSEESNKNLLLTFPFGALGSFAAYRVMTARRPEKYDYGYNDDEDDTESNIAFHQSLNAEAETSTTPTKITREAKRARKASAITQTMDLEQALDSLNNQNTLDKIAKKEAEWLSIVGQLTKK